MTNLYSKRDLALNEFMNPLSTKQAIRDMLARGEIQRTSRLTVLSERVDCWADRHPILMALIAFPFFLAMLIALTSI